MVTGGRRFRPAWAEVDLGAIAHNTATLVRAASGAEVCAVVKADAYGHGSVEVSRAALGAGASSLAVALVEEGIVLREAGIDSPILLLSEPPANAATEVVAQKLTPTVYTAGGVESLGRAAGPAAAASGKPLGVHLKIDTGMHRVGADPTAAVAIAGLIHGHPALQLDAVWTHLAVADDPSLEAVTADQCRIFGEACTAIEAAGIPVLKRHAANSAGALYAGAAYDIIRPGIALYGYAPSPSEPSDLRPALSLKASVSLVKELDGGERLSYGHRYELAGRSVIVTVPLGYADGVPRRLSEVGGCVLVGGERRPIAGAVTMDQILVDCGPGSAVRAGDEVVLIGRQGDGGITAEDWASAMGTISYEILCGISPRVPRVYLP